MIEDRIIKRILKHESWEQISKNSQKYYIEDIKPQIAKYTKIKVLDIYYLDVNTWAAVVFCDEKGEQEYYRIVLGSNPQGNPTDEFDILIKTFNLNRKFSNYKEDTSKYFMNDDAFTAIYHLNLAFVVNEILDKIQELDYNNLVE